MSPLLAFATLLSSAAIFIYLFIWWRVLGVSISENAETISLIIGSAFLSLTIGSLISHIKQPSDNAIKQRIPIALLISAISSSLLLPQLIAPEPLSFLSTTLPSFSLTGALFLFALLLLPFASAGAALSWQSQLLQPIQSAPRFYTLLTAGAAIGIAVAAALSIPLFGLDGSIYFAATLQLISLLIFIKHVHPKITNDTERAPIIATSNKHTAILYLTLFITSFCFIGLSVIWHKYIGLYIGITLYGIATMLSATFALSAIGAYSYHKWRQKRTTQPSLFALLLTFFIGINLSYVLLGMAPQFFDRETYLGELLSQASSLYLLLTILLASMSYGAILVALSQALPLKPLATASQYGIWWFATGSALVTTHYFFIPQYGSNPTFAILSLMPLLFAALILLTNRQQTSKKRIFNQAILLAAFTLVPLNLPSLQLQNILNQQQFRFFTQQSPQTFYYLQEGQSGFVTLSRYQSEQAYIQFNALNQSSVHARHPHKGHISESLSAALAYLLQPNPTNALVIGFNAGTMTRVLANSDLDLVTILDKDKHSIDAMTMLGHQHFSFLDDGRVETLIANPRSALQHGLTDRYSIISMHAPRAWLAGANNFYSQAFYQQIKSHLKEDGIFAFTFSLFRLDTLSMQSILHTFYETFPQGAVFSDLSTGNLILLGSQQALVMDYARSDQYLQNEEVNKTLRFGGLRDTESLPGYFLFSSTKAREISSDAPLITEHNILLEVRTHSYSGILPQQSHDPYQLIRTILQEARIM